MSADTSNSPPPSLLPASHSGSSPTPAADQSQPAEVAAPVLAALTDAAGRGDAAGSLARAYGIASARPDTRRRISRNRECSRSSGAQDEPSRARGLRREPRHISEPDAGCAGVSI